jgi:hypothetical protein
MSQSTNATQVQNASAAMTQAPASSSTQIPDLLKIGSIPSNTQIEVETSILEPVTQSDTHVKFVLQNKGILHSNSKLEFEFTTPNDSTQTDESLLPAGVGIHGLIQRATLRVGTKTICEIDDYNYYAAYKSNFLSSEACLEREQWTSGRMAPNMEIEYTNRTHTPNNAGQNTRFSYGSFFQSNTSSGGRVEAGVGANDATAAGFSSGLTIGTGMEAQVPEYGGDFATPNTEKDVRPVPYQMSLTRKLETANGSGVYTSKQDLCPTWQINISDLFPFLKTNQLPLYMLSEPVNLELVFSSPGSLAAAQNVSSDRCVGSKNMPITIRQESTRMIADHLFYPQELMESYANANRNLQFQYVDYRLSKFSVTGQNAAAGPPAAPDGSLLSTGIRNLGGAGRIVSKVIFGVNPGTAEAGGGYNQNNSPWNKYVAMSPARDYTTGASGDTARKNGTATFNLKYNDQFLFPIDVTNSSRHFHNVVQSEGAVPNISREVYAGEGQVMAPSYWSNLAQAGDESILDVCGYGSQFWNAFRLNRGERINSRGIELYFQMNPMVGDSRPLGGAVDAANKMVLTQRCWLETMRVAELKDGYLECYYA